MKYQSHHIERTSGGQLFINEYRHADGGRGNVIFCCTPIFSVAQEMVAQCYQPIAEHGYNIYAFDFYGTCQSGGSAADISEQSLVADFDTVIQYIRSHSDGPIVLFGDTGTGGALGQYYASINGELAAFAQYGQALYRDVSFMLSTPRWVNHIIYGMMRLMSRLAPRATMNFTVPPFDGYNAAREDQLYADMVKENPDCFKLGLRLMKAVFYILWDRNSPIQTGPSMPTLVFNARHDRYFTNEYVDAYYDALQCEKRRIELDDCHNAYLFQSQKVAADVCVFFDEIIQQAADATSPR